MSVAREAPASALFSARRLGGTPSFGELNLVPNLLSTKRARHRGSQKAIRHDPDVSDHISIQFQPPDCRPTHSLSNSQSRSSPRLQCRSVAGQLLDGSFRRERKFQVCNASQDTEVFLLLHPWQRRAGLHRPRQSNESDPVAHTAIRNFASASVLIAVLGCFAVFMQQLGSAAAKAIRANPDLQKLSTGPPRAGRPTRPKRQSGRPYPPEAGVIRGLSQRAAAVPLSLRRGESVAMEPACSRSAKRVSPWERTGTGAETKSQEGLRNAGDDAELRPRHPG